MDSDQLQLIRRHNPRAVQEMIVELYPQLYRIAAAISGQEDVARGTLRFLLRQSLEVMPKWKDEDSPQRYYLHHLILLLRRTKKHQPAPDRDLLLGDTRFSPEYAAFVQAIRKLPFQQREAFILNLGEKLNARYVAVAMDCSTAAATTHLKSAEDRLRAIAGTTYDRNVAQLGAAYRAMPMPEEIAIPNLRAYVAREISKRWLKRLLGAILLAAIFALLAWIATQTWKIVEY